ncbi:homeobox-leucine zipper protein hox10 [Phtheirospermum japonicum]|uniref:Homeobox-leucine zipper protein hox10 n=1 Tax=Phtheirospermum japonicum TaxID=374723 RepID=A0A830BRZ3_9LAMI|nr:homeobox-leucine zipper protein hox10 [Phtheirospermum japonicum]
MGAYKWKKQKVREPEEEKNGIEHIDGELVLSIERLQEIQDELEKVQWIWKREAPQTTKVNIKLFSKRVIVEQIVEELKLTGDGVYEEFTNSYFGFLMRFDTKGSCCGTALHRLFSHEVIKADAGPDELWYRVEGRFIQFSKYEYALVIGLSFGPTTFDPSTERHPPASGLFLRYYRGQILTLDALRSDFIDGVFRESPADALKCGVTAADPLSPIWGAKSSRCPRNPVKMSKCRKEDALESNCIRLLKIDETRNIERLRTGPDFFMDSEPKMSSVAVDQAERNKCREEQRKELSRFQTVNQNLYAMNKLLMEENDHLQKQVLHLVDDNGHMRQRLQIVTVDNNNKTIPQLPKNDANDTAGLLTIAGETLTQFLGKATGTAVDWVQTIGMKPGLDSIGIVVVSRNCSGIAARVYILRTLEPTKLIEHLNGVALIGPTDANKAKTTHPGRLVIF